MSRFMTYEIKNLRYKASDRNYEKLHDDQTVCSIPHLTELYFFIMALPTVRIWKHNISQQQGPYNTIEAEG